MAKALSYKALHKRIAKSELGQEWIQDALMQQDVWLLTDLGYSQSECEIRRLYKLYFQEFSLPWLKLLTKLTARARSRERHSLDWIHRQVRSLYQLENFMKSRGYFQPSDLCDQLLQQFIVGANGENYRNSLIYATQLWKEEGWLNLQFIPPKRNRKQSEIKNIPEEVLHQIYNSFDLLPPMLERMFRLQLALGCRITEVLTLPRNCLKYEQDRWFLLRWIQKRKQWQFQCVHPLVAELVQEQQKFIIALFGTNTDFDYLFCYLLAGLQNGAKGQDNGFSLPRYKVEKFVYRPTVFPKGQVSRWLRSFSEEADLKDKHSNRFYLTSHMFRRTKASIMAYCEIEDEYIATVLCHTSLDMLPHYRKRSLERLEKDAKTKGYVDMYGRITTFKPRKRRYEELKKLLKVSIPLGECHRPTMLGDCQYRYSCLNCSHHRVTPDDIPKLEDDFNRLSQDLVEALKEGKQRRVTEIKRLLNLIDERLKGLNELQKLISE